MLFSRPTLWLWLCISALVLSASPSWSGTLFPSTYDREIRQAAEQWWPGIPWQLWKAQLYQESRLDPNAQSGVGAQGLAQFMPGTWTEVSRALGYGVVDRRLAGPAIAGGAYYMAQLRRQWSQADLERHRFAAASYNAGAGNIRRAQRACQGAADWPGASACLDQITGRHAAETTGYVRQIWRWFAMMGVGT